MFFHWSIAIIFEDKKTNVSQFQNNIMGIMISYGTLVIVPRLIYGGCHLKFI